MFWGTTPAIDLIEMFKTTFPELIPTIDRIGANFNILIIGGLDIRHVIKTLGEKHHKHNMQNVNLQFHLVEGSLESIARELLQFYIVLQPENRLSLLHKVRFFMELYGNILVRPIVARYLSTVASHLINFLSNSETNISNVHLNLKFRDRDYLENVLKFWDSCDAFDVCDYWDRRMRQFLGTRYDSKIGAFDWDLHMRLHSIGAKTIANQEYRSFRLNGLPFIWLDSEVSKPNRSLVSGIIPQGDKSFAHHGYLGDIQTGPFLTFGLTCDDEFLKKSSNGNYNYRATDIIQRNLMQYFYQILHPDECYQHREFSSILMGNIVMQMPDSRIIDPLVRKELNTVIPTLIGQCVHLDHLSIEILTISVLNLIRFREKYKNHFHIIYIGSMHLKLLDSKTIGTLRHSHCLIIVENPRYCINYREKELQEYYEQIKEFLKDFNCLELESEQTITEKDYFLFLS